MQTETTSSEMTAKHTPGPWQALTRDEMLSGLWPACDLPPTSPLYVVAPGEGDDQLMIAEIPAGSDSPVADDEMRATAALVAAAPDLLAALEASMRALHDLHDGDDLWDCGAPHCIASREAIKKAKGHA